MEKNPWFGFMVSGVFSARPDRFQGSLENILKRGDQISNFSAGFTEQQGHRPFAL
jgi:hypothetical protein